MRTALGDCLLRMSRRRSAGARIWAPAVVNDNHTAIVDDISAELTRFGEVTGPLGAWPDRLHSNKTSSFTLDDSSCSRTHEATSMKYFRILAVCIALVVN